jgi:RNA polymerase sigma factor (sigma-70 family)
MEFDHLATDQFMSFEDFYRSQFRRSVAIGIAMGVGDSAAQDAAQSAMIEVFNKWTQLHNPRGYAAIATRNHVLKIIEKVRAQASLEIIYGPTEVPDEAHQSAEDLLRRVGQAARTLPPTQARIISLVIDGRTTHEIARELDKSEPAIRQSLKRARTALRAKLGLDPNAAHTNLSATRRGKRRRTR